MHFQIFIPASQLTSNPAAVGQSPDGSNLGRVGLADLSINATKATLMAGPQVNGEPLGPGELYTWTAKAQTFFKDNAEWTPAIPVKNSLGEIELPSARYYMGIHKKHPPLVDELLKANRFEDSNPVADESGRTWLIPIASCVPAILGWNAEGEAYSEVLPEFREYWSLAGRYHDLFSGASTEVISSQDSMAFALQALQFNYRMTRELMTSMRILSRRVMHQIIMAALDLKMVQQDLEEAKKKDPDTAVSSSDSSPGQEG